MKINVFIIFIIFVVSINSLYSKVQKITFKPSYGNTLTQADVDNTLKEYGLKRSMLDQDKNKFECIIDNSVMYVGKSAFLKCGIINLTLSNNLISILDSGFQFCMLIKKIVFPESLEEIGTEAFGACFDLVSITFPANSKLKKIKKGGFTFSHITNVSFPESLEEIGTEAFRSCSKLKTINFPQNSNLKTINKYAFFKCNQINQVVFPESLEKLDSNAFDECSKLKTIIFPANSKLYKIADMCFIGTSIIEVIFPKSLINIGETIFSDNLEKMTFQTFVIPCNNFTESTWFITHLCTKKRSNKVLTIKVPNGSKEQYNSWIQKCFDNENKYYSSQSIWKRDYKRNYKIVEY